MLRTESDLALAQSFKNLEPAVVPNFEDDVARNNLHYIHGRKMGPSTAQFKTSSRFKFCGPAPARKFGR